jgi:hypothetical protein
MNRKFLVKPFLPVAAGLAMLTATTLSAKPASAEAGSLSWRGNVDHIARVTIRGRSVNTYSVEGRSPSGVSTRINGTPLEWDDRVWIQDIRGRGEVRVIQQPNRSNNFATVVEIRDITAGSAPYEFRLFWNDDRRRNDRDDDRGRWGNGRPGTNRRGDDRWERGRDDRDRVTPNERSAYDQGYEIGRRDFFTKMRRDAERHRARYDRRTEDEFRRGYNNGYDDAQYRRRG